MRRDHVASTLIRRHFDGVCVLGSTNSKDSKQIVDIVVRICPRSRPYHDLAPDKRGYQEYVFLFLHEIICCGYSIELPRRGASDEFHSICFRGEIRKYQEFLVEPRALSGAMHDIPFIIFNNRKMILYYKRRL